MSTDDEGNPVYRLSSQGGARGYRVIRVPPEIAALIDDDDWFMFRLTPTGFAYDKVEPPSEGLPDWLKKKSQP
jgi:hypothetical protein